MKFIDLFNSLPNIIATSKGSFCLNICFTGEDYWNVSYIEFCNKSKFTVSVFYRNEEAVLEAFTKLKAFVELE